MPLSIDLHVKCPFYKKWNKMKRPIFFSRKHYVTPWPIVLILVCMDRWGPYLPIDTKINFIGGSVRKILGGGCNNPVLVRRVKNSLVRRGLRKLSRNLFFLLISSTFVGMTSSWSRVGRTNPLDDRGLLISECSWKQCWNTQKYVKLFLHLCSRQWVPWTHPCLNFGIGESSANLFPRIFTQLFFFRGSESWINCYRKKVNWWWILT